MGTRSILNFFSPLNILGNKAYIEKIGILLFLIAISFSTYSQELESFTIKVISENEDANRDLAEFENQVKFEIEALLKNRKAVIFSEDYCHCESDIIDSLISKAYRDPDIDMIIALGAVSSAVLARRIDYPKPSIASIILAKDDVTPRGTSGVNNFTYIQSPFSFQNDLKTLYDISPFTEVGVISSEENAELFPNFQRQFENSTEILDVTFLNIFAGSDAESTLVKIPDGVDAIYVFPLFHDFNDEEYEKLFTGLNDKGLPSSGLFGESMVAQGALVGYDSEPNLSKIPRRIALNVSKIVDGVNAKELPVLIRTYSETILINMQTARKIGAYPNWDLATDAVLINANTVETDRTLSLQSTIMEALTNNLNLKIAERNPTIALQEIELSRSKLFPQVDATSSFSLLDKNSSNSSFGTLGRLNWQAGTSLSQLVYSEPAIANVAIQKMLQKGEEAGLQVVQLDVVINAATVFLSVLQAQSFYDVQTSNVSVTKNNLDIAKAKDAVGYSGATDLNRWAAELALDKIDLNTALAQLSQAKYALNEFLNRPIDEHFNVEDIGFINNMLLVNDPRMINSIQNEHDLESLGNFFVKEALARLPELQQIEMNKLAQERLLLSQERAFYLPTVGFSGGWDYTLKRWNAESSVPGAPLPDLKPAWNLGVGISFPVTQGKQRKINQETTKLNLLQIEDQQQDIRNQLELRIRASLQKASASFFSVLQYQEAIQSSNDNFDIVQDAYSQGLTSVTSLIDAQNAKVQTELGAVNASYQYILDFMEVERSIGFYYHLSSATERNDFFNRLNAHMAKN